MAQNTVSQKVKWYLKENKISISYFSKQIGAVQTTINRQLNGDTPLTFDTIDAFLHQFPLISAEWLLRGKGDMIIKEINETNSDSVDWYRSMMESQQRMLESQQKTIESLQNEKRKAAAQTDDRADFAAASGSDVG